MIPMPKQRDNLISRMHDGLGQVYHRGRGTGILGKEESNSDVEEAIFQLLDPQDLDNLIRVFLKAE